MAIKLTKNQPVQTKFQKNFSCDPYDLMQLVQTSDTQKVQVECTPHKLPTNLSIAPWLVGYGTTFIGSTITDNGLGFAAKPIAIVPSRTYQLKFDVAFSAIDSNGGYRVKINNQYINLPDANSGQYSILSGSITAYITIDTSITDPTIWFEFDGTATIVTIKNIKFGELSRVGFSVLNEAKQEIANPGLNYTVAIPNSPYSVVVLLWSDLAALGIIGKCYIHFYDYLEYNINLLKNFNFPIDLNNWQDDTGAALTHWTWDAGRAKYDGAAPISNSAITQLLSLPGGSIYNIEIDVDVAVGCYLTLKINGVTQPDRIFLGSGIHATTLDLSSYTGFVDVRIGVKSSFNNLTMWLNTISLIRVLDAATISNLFNLKERHLYTMTLFGKCNQDAFGFIPFFDFNIRVKAEVLYNEYPDTVEQYDFSNETSVLLNANLEKHYQVTIKGVPEYMHDAITLTRLCDTFKINNHLALKVGQYEIKPNRELPKTSATFLVKNWQGLEDNSNTNGRSSYTEIGYVDEGYW